MLYFLNHRRLITLIITGVVLFFSQSQAEIQDTSKAKKKSVPELPKLTISGTRLEIEAEKLPQKVEVIDKQDLELTVAGDVTDVLKKNASIDVIQYPGILSVAGIRGFRPTLSGINQRTLMLLDGRPAGTTNLSVMQTYNIESIEVIKGPVSALYGPQAMGGIINIIPKRSTEEINSQMKLKVSSFEVFEGQIHSGGRLFKYLNFDFSGAVFNQGKDYRIGSEYSLRHFYDDDTKGKPKHIRRDGSKVIVEDLGDGMVRRNTQYDKKNFSLRIGSDFLDDKISIDVRGEMFNADNVEGPGDIAKGDTSPQLKNSRRHDEHIIVRGNFSVNKFKLVHYAAEEFTEHFGNLMPGEAIFMNYNSGTKWIGFHLKDDIFLPLKNTFLKPVITLGLDFNKAETWSKKWSETGNRIAPYSPGASEKNIGIYSQLFSDIKNGFVTATAGIRYDRMISEILKSSFHPNSVPKKEPFDVFSPSYGITVSPLKSFTNSYSVKLYHNLGKGFVPQPAAKIAGYNINEPDAAGNVEILQGNPDLKPEQNITVDGGMRVGLNPFGINLGIGFYRSVVENFVENDYLSVPAGKTAVYDGKTYPVASIKSYKNNDDKTTLVGLEGDFEWNILHLFKRKEKLTFSTNGHAVLLSEVMSGNEKSEVKNVRKYNFSIGLTYDDNRFLSAKLATRYSGKQTDTDWTATYPYPDVEYPPFLVTDFSIRTRINEHHAIGSQLSNITDENYYEKRGYNLPGRTFGLEYELSF